MEPSTTEAGPSRSSPPPTPSNTKPRRRSWFTFGSPSVVTSSSSSRKGSASSRRQSNADEVELDPVTASASGPSQNVVIIGRQDLPEKEEEQELLNIDGDPEGSAEWYTKSRKKPSKGVAGETVRLADLSTTKTITESPISVPFANSTPPAPIMPPFAIRSFSRTASDRDAFSPGSQKDLTPRQSSESLTLSPYVLPKRSTSMAHGPLTDITPPPTQLQSAFPLDRPLPPLPPPDPNESPPLEVPRGIVVTPSSPHAFLRERKSATHLGGGDESLRSWSAPSSRSRSSSRTRRGPSPRGSAIGLGLPVSLPLSASPRDDMPPPPVPEKAIAKAVSVSSPFPSRSPSPVPKISFAEPQEIKPKDESPDLENEKKTRVKRARSLSGIFGKSPMVSVKPTGSGPTTPEGSEENADIGKGGVKPHGMLEWLGVKKVVKRRQSESRLRADSTDEPEEIPDVPTIKARDKIKSRESLGLDAELEEGQFDNTRRPRRPDIRAVSSTTTVVPNNTGKLSTVFNRRSSSRGRDSDESPGPHEADARAIPSQPFRHSTAASSQSSFTLPPIDSAPPMFGQHAELYTSSPTTEAEEMLFSPGTSAHWGPGVRPWMDGLNGGRGSDRSGMSSPLGSLPEQGHLDTIDKLKAQPEQREGRLRSWSDAPRPQPARPSGNNSQPHLPTTAPDLAPPLPTPVTPTRPAIGERSNSGNSAIIGRMRNVFAFSKGSSRGRSNTLGRQDSSDMDEFGGLRPQDWPASARMRPSSSSSSSLMNSPRLRARSSVDQQETSLFGLGDSERRIFLNDPPDSSPRASFTGSISSVQTNSGRPSTGADLQRETSTVKRLNRARASTISSGQPTHYNLQPPISPNLFPATATPPRRRPSVMQRISNSRFGSTASSPKGGSLFPLPARSSGSISSSYTGLAASDDASPFLSPGSSPRPSTGSISANGISNVIKQAAVIRDGETPVIWLDRVTSTIGREEISNVLATSGDEFHTEALRIYMNRFDFMHNALDVALRKLLMHMSLPRETQQIDRIIEAFSVRYEECEPGLFLQKDNTYILAFSMMMLHTDAFNKHNKNKMSKQDYVRNTRLEGVPPLVLEAFFDNITFTPFVFIEDDADLKRASNAEAATPSTARSSTPTFSGTVLPPKSGKIDVYHMLVRGLLGSLRVDVEQHIPAETPFSGQGTRPRLDIDGLHRAFTYVHTMHVTPPRPKVPSKLASTSARISSASEGEMTLKVTKVGLLSRRDEDTANSKKSSRKWKSWSVILTGSQLLFFKDPAWALTLLEQAKAAANSDQISGGVALLPPVSGFKPDEVFPVRDCIAIYDRDYTRHPHSFRFILPSNRQYLMQASDEYEMNEWIALINYASAFKTAGIRMRGSAMQKDQAVLAGAAAAASHQRELRERDSYGSELTTPPKAVFGDTGESAVANGSSHPLALAPVGGGKGVAGVDAPDDLVDDEGDQLEQVFDIVKAELAAGRGGATKLPSVQTNGTGRRPRADSARSVHAERVDAIMAQIQHFTSLVEPIRTQLSSNLRIARNLAILTPFQKTTRDRIAQAIPSIAQRIRADRLQLAKLELWTEILQTDLEREKRDWTSLRHVALQAAAKSLRDPQGVKSVVDAVNASTEPTAAPVPQLSLSSPDNVQLEKTAHVELSSSPGELPVNIRRSSGDLGPEPGANGNHPTLSRQASTSSWDGSTSRPELRRSASDYLSAHSTRTRSSDPLVSLDRAGADGASPDSPTTPVMFNLSDVDEEDTPRHRKDAATMTTTTTAVKNGNEKEKESGEEMDMEKRDEEAEHWQNTRAARRVSLAMAGVGEGEMRELSRRVRRRQSEYEDGLSRPSMQAGTEATVAIGEEVAVEEEVTNDDDEG
ncbi:hypothetical protein BCR39DRAFT_554628 [Naematelia encephala]|uniref:SEC7 domain-containing protein n=1 Tax=Naematelia encephala TaxID=71784 RepID=A0A1Y2AF16_9TREE|nr:hypothetical protein BCR39DRAFT_554628 [Naematelia encephala]